MIRLLIGLVAALALASHAAAEGGTEPRESDPAPEGETGPDVAARFEGGSAAPTDPFRIAFVIDNDTVVGTDRHYTSGLKLALVTGRGRVPDVVRRLAKLLPPWSGEGHQHRFGLALAQDIYTNEDPTKALLGPTDRPNAGWLYLETSLLTESDVRVFGGSLPLARLDSLDLRFGVVGPSAGGREVQSLAHRITESRIWQSWNQQLGNEFGFVARLERRWRTPTWVAGWTGIETDLLPHVALDLGNVSTGVDFGATLRLGLNLPWDFGRGRINTLRPHARRGGLALALQAGVEGKWVLHTIFLDGNTVRASHRVAKRPFFGRFPVRLALQWRRLHLALGVTWKSLEFIGQDGYDAYGTLAISLDY